MSNLPHLPHLQTTARNTLISTLTHNHNYIPYLSQIIISYFDTNSLLFLIGTQINHYTNYLIDATKKGYITQSNLITIMTGAALKQQNHHTITLLLNQLPFNYFIYTSSANLTPIISNALDSGDCKLITKFSPYIINTHITTLLNDKLNQIHQNPKYPIPGLLDLIQHILNFTSSPPPTTEITKILIHILNHNHDHDHNHTNITQITTLLPILTPQTYHTILNDVIQSQPPLPTYELLLNNLSLKLNPTEFDNLYVKCFLYNTHPKLPNPLYAKKIISLCTDYIIVNEFSFYTRSNTYKTTPSTEQIILYLGEERTQRAINFHKSKQAIKLEQLEQLELLEQLEQLEQLEEQYDNMFLKRNHRDKLNKQIKMEKKINKIKDIEKEKAMGYRKDKRKKKER